MIQRSHLTAWQAYAPWDKRSKIEQDLRLTRGIAAIFADEMCRDEAERLLRDRVQDPSFRRDMNTLLRADYGTYDINAAAELVLDTYLVHLE
jgi:hypothetical protein